ncbi:MAG: hypothetical protein ABI838_00495 [Chloroflexota bacterium]
MLAVERTYVSKLRAQQAESTRLRVIDGVASVLARDLSELTFPAVAAEAEVSVATVRRLFPTKRDLVEGLAKHYAATIGSVPGRERSPTNIEELLALIPEVMVSTSRISPALRAAASSEVFQEYRRENRAERLRPVEEVLKPFRADFPDGQLRRLRDVVVVLCSSAGLAAFTDLIGSSPEETAETVAWAIRKLLGLDDRSGPTASKRPT